MIYPVNNIYASIQGEGYWSGTPMVIVRLQGCDVGCVFCDTKETWDKTTGQVSSPTLSLFPKAAPSNQWVNVSPEIVASYIAEKFPTISWVLVTGGEPALYDLTDLVTACHGFGLSVALETSGTADGFVDAGFDWVTVSPKIHLPNPSKPVKPELVKLADEIKMVVGRQADITKFENLLTEIGHFSGEVSLQPMSASEQATKLCIDKVLATPKWRLSVQIHKVIGVM